MNLTRRGFLAGIIAAGVAPLIVRPGLLMPVKPSLTAGTGSSVNLWLSDFGPIALVGDMKDTWREIYMCGGRPDLMVVAGSAHEWMVEARKNI